MLVFYLQWGVDRRRKASAFDRRRRVAFCQRDQTKSFQAGKGLVPRLTGESKCFEDTMIMREQIERLKLETAHERFTFDWMVVWKTGMTVMIDNDFRPWTSIESGDSTLA